MSHPNPLFLQSTLRPEAAARIRGDAFINKTDPPEEILKAIQNTEHSVHPFDHLRRLAAEIGPRPSGSPGNHAAADYIREVFSLCGLNVETQSFETPAWHARLTQLNTADESLEAEANTYSPACDVTAPVTPLCSLEELEQTDLSGRVAVLYGDLTKAPLPAKAWMFKDEREARVVELLDGGSHPRPVAVLTVQNRPGLLERLVEDWEFSIPSATVPAEAGRQLIQAAAVHLRIESEQHPGQTTNIVARKPGPRSKRIVLCAHYDTKIDTPGASDNGGGVAVMLALAEQLSRAELNCGLEFVAFTNEEYLPIGDDEYVRRGENYFGSILAAINFDGVGPALGANTLAALAASPEFETHVRQIQRDHPGVVWVKPWPESNHSTFAWRNVPSLALSNTATLRHAHLRSDTVDWLSAAKLNEVIRLATNIVLSLQDKTLAWARKVEGQAA